MPNSKNVRKLRKSKKYAIGAEHMTGGGKIKVLDRYVEDGVILLKYWHFEEEREIINKEVNVNRLIYDYQQKVKAESFEKLQEGSGEVLQVQGVNSLEDVHKGCKEATERLTEEIEHLREDVEHLTNLVMRLSKQLRSK